MMLVKVGGSLFDHPKLGPVLAEWLAIQSETKILLVAGGGRFANAVRQMDRIHKLGEEASHWAALASLAAPAAVLKAMLEPYNLPKELEFIDCLAFAQSDDDKPMSLPHTWQVTTDSLAARIAVVHGCTRLVLLKSLEIPEGTSWDVAAKNGWIDEHFPTIANSATFLIEMVNFRIWLDQTRNGKPVRSQGTTSNPASPQRQQGKPA